METILRIAAPVAISAMVLSARECDATRGAIAEEEPDSL
jgi:hypothetical protein